MTNSGFTECDNKHCLKPAEHEIWFDDMTVEELCESCARKTYFNDDDAVGMGALDPGCDFDLIT